MIANLPHVLSRLYAPLLIEQHKLEVILRSLDQKLLTGTLAARPDSGGAEQKSYSVVNGVATIPITGTLVNRSSGMDAFSGMTSYQSLSSMLSEALADTSVQAIMLDVDSPGGEVSGCFDLADQIYAARQQKPVWALVNDMAASAGYALASSAEKIIVSRTSIVGSIGVIYPHVDVTAADEMMGVKYDFITAGKQKADGSPHIPMSDEARSRIQSEVDSVYNIFVATVARNRALAAGDVRATEAGVFMGKTAIKAGLADNIGTFEGAYSALSKRVKKGLSAQSGMARKENNMSLWDKVKAQLSQPDDDTDAGQDEAEEYTLAANNLARQNVALNAQHDLSVKMAQVAQPVEDPQVAALKAKLADFEAKAKADADRQQLVMAQACLREAVGYADMHAAEFAPSMRGDAIIALGQSLAFERGISAFFGYGTIDPAYAIENHPANVAFTLGEGKSNLAASVRALMSGTKSKEAMKQMLGEGLPSNNLRAISSTGGKNDGPDPVSAALQIVYGGKP